MTRLLRRTRAGCLISLIITEDMVKVRAGEGHWLYNDMDGGREFAVEVCAPDGVDLSDWHECTDAERVEYLTHRESDE